MIVIIGGGFFGMYIAEYLARRGKRVLLCEKDSDFMQRASYANQARVHNGYHYPRSVLTALRSRISFPRFCEEFPDCVDSSFEKYYMVGSILGKVTAKQFEKFCQRIGAPCELAPHKITRLVNPNLIEAVFATTEYAFDAIKLKDMMRARLEDAGVEYRLSTRVQTVQQDGDRVRLQISPTQSPECVETIVADQVFNCTYSMINNVLKHSDLDMIPLKHEITEMCLVEVPDELRDKGITVMCGPFFSVIPFPSEGLHTFSHVRYTPHHEWHDHTAHSYRDAHVHYLKIQKRTAWRKMVLDAQRYMPVLADCEYKRSLWEVKTVLPRSEVDDSRPILFKAHHGMKGFHCVMGGKIDNVYEAVNTIKEMELDG